MLGYACIKKKIGTVFPGSVFTLFFSFSSFFPHLHLHISVQVETIEQTAEHIIDNKYKCQLELKQGFFAVAVCYRTEENELILNTAIETTTTTTTVLEVAGTTTRVTFDDANVVFRYLTQTQDFVCFMTP